MNTTKLGKGPRNFTLRQAAERKAGKLIPKEVFIEVTHKCNLRCLHCGLENSLNKGTSGELTFNEITGILEQLFKYGVLGVSISGGEPLCRPDLLDIMEHAQKIGLFFGLKTNGTLLTEAIVRRLKALGITTVHLSVYGATPEAHERVTGLPGSFKKTIHAVELLKSANIRVGLKTSIMKCNFQEDLPIAALAKQLGVAHNVDPIILPKFDQPGSADGIRINDEQLHQLILQCNWINLDTAHFIEDPEAHLLCSGGKISCSISPNGDVFPCSLWPVRLGNLREQTFRDVWQGEAAESIRAITVNDFPDCIKCELLKYCTRCPGMVLMENSGISGPSPENCRLARAVKGVINDEEIVHEPHYRDGKDQYAEGLGMQPG